MLAQFRSPVLNGGCPAQPPGPLWWPTLGASYASLMLPARDSKRVEWHPLCQSLVGVDGTHLDDAALAEILGPVLPEELPYCGHLDLTVAWHDEDDFPTAWVCPKCGGAVFTGARRDYPRSEPQGVVYSWLVMSHED